MTRTSTLFALLSISLAACDGGSADKDSASDSVEATGTERPGDDTSNGTQARTAHIVGSAAAGSESGSIQVHLAATGELVGEGEIGEDGRYVAMVEAETEAVIVSAFDAAGELRGEVLVAATGEAESTTSAAPMTSETRLEAEVYVAAEAEASAEAEAEGEGEAESTAIADLRARIDAEVAAAVDAAPDREEAVRSLSIAILAAQETEARAMATFDPEHSEDFDSRAAVDVEVLAEVDAMLDSGMSSEDADRWLLAAEDAAAAAAEISVEARAEAESSASLALRTTLDAMASLGSSTWAVADASARVAAEHEAHFSSLTAEAIVEASAHGEAVSEATLEAQAELEARLEAEGDREDAAAAWASFEAAVVGSAEALLEPEEMEEGEDDSALLGLITDLDVDAALDIVSVVEAAADATVMLEAEVEALANTYEPEMSSEEVAESVVEARLAFHSEVYGSVDSASSELAADLIVMASGGFVAGGAAR